jgi:hypothetical protein
MLDASTDADPVDAHRPRRPTDGAVDRSVAMALVSKLGQDG